MLGQLADATETRVTDLARRHRLSLNTVSKHLRVLERGRLVERRVVGREHLIRIEPTQLAEIEQWLAQHHRFWTARLDALAAFFEDKHPNRKGKDDE